MDGQSLNITSDLITKLKEIIPSAFTEDKLNIEQLKQLLGEDINTDNERYQLNWAGKNEAYKTLQTPLTSTLIPDRESSVNWDDAEHIFIEGDNLDVLKVLQKSYYGKIKMIYIDPPYNTGSDSFVYPDKFTETKEEYFSRIGNFDESGNLKRDILFKKNSRENGQFHSNWLNMMLPRLFLARNLLADEGAIFISIDDNEQANLKLLMDEIFGEENFIANMVRENKAGAGHDSGLIAIEYDYTLMYGKNKSKLNLNKKILDVENDSKYRLSDSHVATRGKYYLRDLDYRGTYSQSGDYEIVLPSSKKIFPGGKYGPPNTWRWSSDKVKWGLENDFIVLDDKKEKVYIKQYQFVDNEGKQFKRQIPYRALTKFMNGKGSKEVDTLLGNGIFSFPKSTEMIKYFLEMVINDDKDIVLDFFAGSGTTSHSVIEFNNERGKSVKSISIQLPEMTEPNSEANNEIMSAIAKAKSQLFIDNLRNRHPNVSFDSKLRGYIGELAVKRWLEEHNISLITENYIEDGGSIDIDLIYRRDDKIVDIELKTSLIPDIDKNFENVLLKRDIKLIRRGTQSIEDLKSDIHIQVYFRQLTKAKDEWLKQQNIDLNNNDLDYLYKSFGAARYEKDTYLFAWIDRPTLIRQINNLPENKRCWNFGMREFWKCNLRNDAKKPLELIQYLNTD